MNQESRKAGKVENEIISNRWERALAAETLNSQGGGRKIQQEPVLEAGRFEIAAADREVNILERADSFQLNDHQILD